MDPSMCAEGPLDMVGASAILGLLCHVELECILPQSRARGAGTRGVSSSTDLPISAQPRG